MDYEAVSVRPLFVRPSGVRVRVRPPHDHPAPSRPLVGVGRGPALGIQINSHVLRESL